MEIKKLDIMCSAAQKAKIGSKLQQLAEDLSAGTNYTGEQLTVEEKKRLNNMCVNAQRVALGNVLDDTFTKAASGTTIPAITEEQAAMLNKMCITSFKVEIVDGEATIKGLGDFLVWAAGKTVDTDNKLLSFTVPNQSGETVINDSNGHVDLFYRGDKSNLVATFTVSRDASVKVNNVPQVSGVTANDFTSVVNYIVTSESGVPRTYNVNITSVYLATITESNATANITDAEGHAVTSGGEIYEGEILTLNATAAEGYENPTFTIGAQTYPAGSTYTVTGDTTFELSAKPAISPTFADNDWAKIKQACQNGEIPATWAVGDTKEITGKDGNTYHIRLADKQAGRYNYSNSALTTHAVFEFVELPNIKTVWNPTATNAGGLADSQIRKNLNGLTGVQTGKNFLTDIIPEDLRPLLEEVNIVTSTGGTTYTGTSTSANKLFPPCYINVKTSITPQYVAEGTLWGYYSTHTTDDDSKKALVTNLTSYQNNWTASPYSGIADYVHIVSSSGYMDSTSANISSYVAPCFAW